MRDDRACMWDATARVQARILDLAQRGTRSAEG